MGITKISIKNYKSIKSISINLEREKYDLQCFIGENGAGKSNLLDAIDYFYRNLSGDNIKQEIIDINNKYLQFAEIELEYDFSQLTIKNTNPYFDEKMLDLYGLSENNKIRVKMVQYKDGTVKWYPKEMDQNKRRLVHKLFPVFFIDTRFVSLQNWSDIWNDIADISISKLNIEKDDIRDQIDELMSDAYGEKYSKTISIISQVFENEGIKIDESSYQEQYIDFLKLRLGGNNFLSEENKLSYYSDGLNSLKYIKLVIELISNLSSTGWKNPLLVIDEPEIGLHSRYIDELVECIQLHINKNVNMILTTHSPHFVTSIIRNDISISIWRIFYRNEYSRFEKMREIIDDKQKYLIGDIETSCFFSNALLFVEGKTEKQLFFNKRLQELYPNINKINITNFDSDNSSLDLVYPERMKFSVPYLVLVDMDKILSYSYKTNKFKVKSDNLINPLYNKEVRKKQKFLYYKNQGRKEKTYYNRCLIDKMIDKATFVQNNSKFYIDDYFFERIIQNVKNYCIQYNTLPVRTTIEGVMANEDNVEIVYEWLENKLDSNLKIELKNILDRESIDNKKYRATIIRCCLNGKLDTLKNIDENKVLIDHTVKKIIKKVQRVVGKKTGGWIGEFIEYYFSTYIDVLDVKDKKLDRFSKDFKELNYILRRSISMLE